MRKFEIEMSAHFSYKHTPLDEFGHMLFTDWSDEEWSKFDNYMIQCEQYYLQNGLVTHNFNNLEARKFIKETCFEFYQWCNEGNLKIGERIDKSIMFQSFTDEYTDMKKWLTQRRYTKWLEQWAMYKGYEYSDGKSGSLRWVLYGVSDSVLDNCPF